MKRLRVAAILICILLVALALTGCPGTQKPTIDQAIQYRAAFNGALGSFNTNLAALPQPTQQKYAEKAVPFVKSGVAALDTMDAMVAAGGPITPETLQQYMDAKNKLIDMVAEMILEKGGK